MIHYVFMFLCRNVYTSPLEFYKQYIKTLQFFLNTEVYPLSWTEKSNLEGILVMKSDDAFKKQIVEANQRGEGSYQTLVNRYSGMATLFLTKIIRCCECCGVMAPIALDNEHPRI